MTAIHGLVVARNEADRYLPEVLAWLGTFLDDCVVYDDGSTDDTINVALNSGAQVVRRPGHVPAFLENEAGFRQAAWEAVTAKPGDWVFCVDADEFPVAAPGYDETETVRALVREAAHAGAHAVSFPVAEAFGFGADGCPLIRTDAQWSTITAARLANWQPDCQFTPRMIAGQPQKLAVGSLPGHVTRVVQHHALTILHLGYARREDQVERHGRYRGVRGHSAPHVASILARPTLERWAGKIPALFGQNHV